MTHDLRLIRLTSIFGYGALALAVALGGCGSDSKKHDASVKTDAAGGTGGAGGTTGVDAGRDMAVADVPVGGTGGGGAGGGGSGGGGNAGGSDGGMSVGDARPDAVDAPARPDATPDVTVRPDLAPDMAPAMVEKKKRAIIFVWDGLRPDSINATDTPTLNAMKTSGAWFDDNHSTYPTFTMMNAASFATGGFPADTSFYGNTLYEPGAKPGKLNNLGQGVDGNAGVLDFSQPVFTEDYQVLDDLRAYYGGALFKIGSLFEAAQAKGLKTAAVGKSGAAYIQDYKRGGIILDERFVWPLDLAQSLQANGFPLPLQTPRAYAPGATPDGGAADAATDAAAADASPAVVLAADNGSPTGAPAKVTLASEGPTSDPTYPTNSFTAANAYMMRAFTDLILPYRTPDLTLIWFRNPDSTEHAYGVGTPAYRDALKAQDDLLKSLLDKLAAYGIADMTDVIVVSDHGHSNVSGPLALFPLRGLSPNMTDAGAANGSFGAVDPAGYSVSGDVRMAHLITNAGIGVNAYDGTACVYDPVLSGVKPDGTRLYPTMMDTTGACGGTMDKPVPYNWPSYRVPAMIPAGSVVIAANGGSEYIYATDTDPAAATATVAKVVAFLQKRQEVGAIFVAHKHGTIAGTLPLDLIRVEGTGTRNPDVVYSFTWDQTAMIQGVPGIEFESAQMNRGMHGSFSPIDVHNALVAKGPDFKTAFVDPLPSGNVDVAPTLAQILQVALPAASGRPLKEALSGGPDPATITAAPMSMTAAPSAAMQMVTPLGDTETTMKTYSVKLQTKQLTQDGKTFTYFDWAQAIRQ